MVRYLTSAERSAIGNRSFVSRAHFVLVTARDGEGDPAPFGFTTFGEDRTLDVVDGLTGDTVERAFYGDDAPIVAIDPMPYAIGLEVQTTNVTLNPLHPAVETMARGYDIRNAPVQILRGWLDAGGVPLAPPRARRIGQINGAPIHTARIGGKSQLVLKVVSHTRELTRTNTAKWSDETQRQRSDDRFLRYVGITAQVPVWWGEKKSD